MFSLYRYREETPYFRDDFCLWTTAILDWGFLSSDHHPEINTKMNQRNFQGKLYTFWLRFDISILYRTRVWWDWRLPKIGIHQMIINHDLNYSHQKLTPFPPRQKYQEQALWKGLYTAVRTRMITTSWSLIDKHQFLLEKSLGWGSVWNVMKAIFDKCLAWKLWLFTAMLLDPIHWPCITMLFLRSINRYRLDMHSKDVFIYTT